MNPNNITSILHPKYCCQYCDFKCSKTGDWNRHILTSKHQILTNPNNFTSLYIEQKKYTCQCGKKYKHMSSLCAHKKKCQKQENAEYNEEIIIDGINIKDKDTLVLHLLKQNSELQNKIIELSSKHSITNNNSHNTTNNNSFNINLFLNETCKNAMNIYEFVSSIEFNLEDLEYTGRNGYINGISHIIINKLNNIEQHMRPLHCSDCKREILYIKENDKWTKETQEKPILKKAIKDIANENIKQILKWREKYPDCHKANSKKNDLYLKIVSNSMNGLTKEEAEKNINRIINNVARSVIINK